MLIMPQELHVVQCYDCSNFQVDIVKRVPKWQCKVCNVKQSLKKVFMCGSGKDCRSLVQQLNEKRLLRTNEEFNETVQQPKLEGSSINARNHSSAPSNSKWNVFLENKVENNVNPYLSNTTAQNQNQCSSAAKTFCATVSNLVPLENHSSVELSSRPNSNFSRANIFEADNEDVELALDM